jgi:hypothetical protein
MSMSHLPLFTDVRMSSLLRFDDTFPSSTAIRSPDILQGTTVTERTILHRLSFPASKTSSSFAFAISASCFHSDISYSAAPPANVPRCSTAQRGIATREGKCNTRHILLAADEAKTLLTRENNSAVVNLSDLILAELFLGVLKVVKGLRWDERLSGGEGGDPDFIPHGLEGI